MALHLLGDPLDHAADPLIEVGQCVDRIEHVIAGAEGSEVALASTSEQVELGAQGAHILLQLSEAFGLPYADLMRLCGYRVPGESESGAAAGVTTALFADLTDDEREELLEYLAWYRARRRSARTVVPAG